MKHIWKSVYQNIIMQYENGRNGSAFRNNNALMK